MPLLSSPVANSASASAIRPSPETGSRPLNHSTVWTAESGESSRSLRSALAWIAVIRGQSLNAWTTWLSVGQSTCESPRARCHARMFCAVASYTFAECVTWAFQSSASPAASADLNAVNSAPWSMRFAASALGGLRRGSGSAWAVVPMSAAHTRNDLKMPTLRKKSATRTS